MVFQIRNVFYFNFLIFIITIYGYKEDTKDQTSTRANTLFDDADDIQRQLNNEAHDKMLYGKNFSTFQKICRMNKPKTTKKLKQIKQWSYKDQSNWYKQYPACRGRSQSPVELPAVGLIKTKGCRKLTFHNYDIVPKSLTLKNNAKRLVLYGQWKCERQPVVYGGAAHSRRYLFHSMTLHWPSEHRIGGLQYPLESQVIHISAEYKTLNDAINAAPRDAQAILGIVNLYKYSNEAQTGISELIHVAQNSCNIDAGIPPQPLACFNPPLKEYVAYQGSLTMPPCTENVLWLVRARALPVTRELVNVLFSLDGEGELRGSFVRQPQPLNDRKVYFFT